MIFMNLRLKQNPKGLTFTIPWPNRLFFILLLAVYAVSFQSGEIQPWYLHVLACISLVGLCYREAWIFDRQQKEIRYTFGILIPWKKLSFNYKQIEAITLQCFIRGESGWIDPESDRKNLFTTHQSILKLQTPEGDHILETGINRKSVVLQNIGIQLAEELNCPFYVNP